MSYNFNDRYDNCRNQRDGGFDDCGCDVYDNRGKHCNDNGRDERAGRSRDCDECGREGRCDEFLFLAIATVPMQRWRLTYSPEKALGEGTMFAELNLPFKGGKRR